MKFWIIANKNDEPEIAEYEEGFYKVIGDYSTIYHYGNPHYIDGDTEAHDKPFNRVKCAQRLSHNRRTA